MLKGLFGGRTGRLIPAKAPANHAVDNGSRGWRRRIPATTAAEGAGNNGSGGRSWVTAEGDPERRQSFPTSSAGHSSQIRRWRWRWQMYRWMRSSPATVREAEREVGGEEMGLRVFGFFFLDNGEDPYMYVKLDNISLRRSWLAG